LFGASKPQERIQRPFIIGHTKSSMAPLIERPQHDHAFSTTRFSLPLREELPEATQPPSSSRRRRVQFAQTTTIINTAQEFYDASDIEIKWWTSVELIVIRSSVKETVATLRGGADGNKQEQRSDSCLAMAHHKTTLMLSSDFKGLMKLSPTTPEQDLYRWSSHADGRRGLERFVSRDYCCFRRRDIASTRTGVLKEQFRQKQQQGICEPELIAKLAREASRRARSFSLFMGEADALAAGTAKKAPPTRKAPPRKRSKMEHGAHPGLPEHSRSL
jgi:hypothetical protein